MLEQKGEEYSITKASRSTSNIKQNFSTYKPRPPRGFPISKKINFQSILIKNIFIFVLRTTKNKMMIVRINPAVHAQASGTSGFNIQLNTFQPIAHLKKR